MYLTGWGRSSGIEARGFFLKSAGLLRDYLKLPQDYIVYGMGRSYGDSALNSNILLSRRFNKMLHFDEARGVIVCESGVTLSEIIDIFLPRGWFLPVVPGTKQITVGGAIASDVHGKNHHKVGCFSEFVLSFELMLPSGEIVSCDREQNQELFHATCGGMGLTGIILTVTLLLQPIKSSYIRETIIRCNDLDEILGLFDAKQDATYSVGWIDCLARGRQLGRSVLMLGEHANSGPLWREKSKAMSIPFNLPGFFLNKYSIASFNKIYYAIHPNFTEGRLVPLDKFFFPLDKINSWNRMYGRRGFTQYQFVLPKEGSYAGLKSILQKIAETGLGSFLAVIKLFGKENNNYLSFPLEGYTVALDFKIQPKLFPLLDELDLIVVDHGGRLYLAKDVRMRQEIFRESYPGWKKFLNMREKLEMKVKFNSIQSQRLGL
jgi:decaprenylphospho-beta-D-ribofuranose 2-oxidase